MKNPFRYFNSSREIIRLTVMMYVRYPLSLRQVEDILFERGIDICHETVRFWWSRCAHPQIQTNPEKSLPAFSNLAIADCASARVSDTYFVSMVSTCCIE